jgi:hypothetical protein
MSILILAQQYITRYVLSKILALGNVGNLVVIMVFSQKKHRVNSCSIYLVTVSVFGCIADNWAIAPLVYALDHFDMINSSLILCRIRGYIIHANAMFFRYTVVLMCADRYALCSSRISVPALCRSHISCQSIGITIVFWTVVSIHLLIWESIENNRCAVYGVYGQIIGYYNLIFIGIIPISVMISSSIFMLNALRQVRFRVRPLDNTRQFNRRDINLVKLTLVEVVVYILCTFGYPLTIIYMNTTNNIVLKKTTERRQIELFINFVTMSLLVYLNYNTTFYVHFCTSKTYRIEMKQLIVKLIRKSRGIEQT